MFICSTCYDLVDLRAELQSELVNMGLTPVLSDQAASDFTVAPDANSIESCLANVRACDIFVIVLSQRYGPSLQTAGYDDISASHLEYRTARRLAKPIYMYVRDRLEGEYSVWKRNRQRNLRLAWVKRGDEGVFDLLEEHRELVGRTEGSNWIWTFRDSVDLRRRLRRDLGIQSASAALTELLQSGRVPLLLAGGQGWPSRRGANMIELQIVVRNVGTAPAIDPEITLRSAHGVEAKHVSSLAPGEQTPVEYEIPVPDGGGDAGTAGMEVICKYLVIQGHTVMDVSRLRVRSRPGSGADLHIRGAFLRKECCVRGQGSEGSSGAAVEDSG